MTEPSTKKLEAERNKLWAEARMKGLPRDTPERERIAELDAQIRDLKAAAKLAKPKKNGSGGGT